MKHVAVLMLLLGVSYAAKETVNRKSPLLAEARDGAHHGGGGHGGGHGGHHGHDLGHESHVISSVSHGSKGHGGGHGGGHATAHISHGKGGFGGGGGGGSYSAPHAGPSASYGEEPAKDTGFYYYYYPVVPNNKGKKGIFNSGSGFFGKMLDTFMSPFMRMYDYFDGRSFAARASDYLPLPIFQKAALMIQEELYKEECLSRTICQLGKTAEGYETFLSLSEFFVPEEYQGHLQTFKNSALKKSDCRLTYKCTSMSPSAQQL